MADDLGERSELPTSKKREESRKKGQVAKSQDLSSIVTLLGTVVLLIVFGGSIAVMFSRVLSRMLQFDSQGMDTSVGSLAVAARYAFGEAGMVMLPIFLLAAFVGYIGQFIQIGWLFSGEPIRPKLSKLSIKQGVGRVFGKRALAKGAINTLKLAVTLIIAFLVIRSQAPAIAALPKLSMMAAFGVLVRMIVLLVFILLLLLALIALLDLIYQRWQHTQDLKMTKQEVKDERRTMEGDPQIKGRRMQMAREIVMQRLGKAVPEADVIVTNPTHFSVAIKYDTDGTGAPRVTAKGVDEIAFRIRQLARTNDVPIVERPPLARALYWGVEIGQEISPEHYEAVAEILAYVYRLDGRADEARRAASPSNQAEPAPA